MLKGIDELLSISEGDTSVEERHVEVERVAEVSYEEAAHLGSSPHAVEPSEVSQSSSSSGRRSSRRGVRTTRSNSGSHDADARGQHALV